MILLHSLSFAYNTLNYTTIFHLLSTYFMFTKSFGLNFETFFNSVNNLRSSSVNFFGIAISVFIIKFPLWLFSIKYPLFGIDIWSPFCVPFGTIIVTSPSMPFTEVLHPNAASQGVTNNLTYISLFFNSYIELFFIFICIIKSPFFPPFFPIFP